MFVSGIDSGAHAQYCGNKGHNLAQLSKAGFSVPEWIAVSPSAFTASLSASQRDLYGRLLIEADSVSRVTLSEQLFNTFSLAREIQNQLAQSLGGLGDCLYYAVRSSSLEEDGINQSYAGLFESYLYVPPDLLLKRINDVWKSAFSERVALYRRQNGVDVPSVPAVIVQKMVSADVAGVTFSVDPVSGSDELCIVESVYGLGEGLVSGELDSDSWSVDRGGNVVRERLASKVQRVGLDAKSCRGTRLFDVAEKDRHLPSLSRDEIAAVARCARDAQSYFGTPTDIEWCLSSGVIYLLQARPITTLKLSEISPPALPCEPVPVAASLPGASASGPLRDLPESLSVNDMNVWDSSNISESYPGVTTPLTFTFAKKAYEHVYREFLKLMGVNPKVIEQNSNVYPCMLGLIHGRMYYNLPSWFKLLSLLPAFGSNAGHMETMMGLKEPLPESLMRQIRADAALSKSGTFAVISAAIALTLNLVSLKRCIWEFERRVDDALGDDGNLLTGKSVLELGRYYRVLESRLLRRWDAPIVNDFFAMIFYGVLRKLCNLWLGDKDGSLQNQLISCQSGVISAEPARRIVKMAGLAAPYEKLVHELCHGTASSAMAEISKYPDLDSELHDYLRQFGDRCLEELKLETPTLNDSPEMLLRSIGLLAQSGSIGGASQLDAPEVAVSQLLKALNPFQLLLFNFVLAQAKERIRHRENLRFMRTRVFGKVRRVFLAIGRKLVFAGVLHDERDVFFLEVEEVLAFTEGTSTCAGLNEIVSIRKTEFVRNKQLSEPPVRITTRGIPSLSADLRVAPSQTKPEAEESLGDAVTRIKGIPCSPGKVRGRVRVITDPSQARLAKGDIIVARRTDPGWILLFPIAAGLIVEHGSLLSHSAIVSRELGLPAIVGVCNATHLLKDGDEVEFDGRTGDIEVVERKESSYVSA